MGEHTGTKRTTLTGSGDPEQISEEIESTRQELGDTVAALSARTDVKTRSKQSIENVKVTVADKKEELLGKGKEASPKSAAAAASRASQRVRHNPLPLGAAGAFVFGFLAGRVTKR